MNSNKKPVISLGNIAKTFLVSENRANSIREIFTQFRLRSKPKEVKAIQTLNLDIYEGECFGIIGSNGSGKSTLMNIMMGSIRPDKGGKVYTDGTMMRLALGMGVDQNLSARDNVYVNGSVIGLSFKRIGEIFDDIIEFAGLKGFEDTQIKFYSSGMKNRLLFSIAMYAEADIFLLDEFFGGVGDEDFKKKSNAAFQSKIMNGQTIVIISHTLGIIQQHCTRCMWLEKGEVKVIGDTNDVLKEYQEFAKKKQTPRKKEFNKNSKNKVTK